METPEHMAAALSDMLSGALNQDVSAEDLSTRLTQRELLVLYERHVNGESWVSMANRFKIDSGAIQRIAQRANQKLVQMRHLKRAMESLLEMRDDSWSPTWQPTAHMLAWFRNFLNRTRPGVWAVPATGQIYNINPQTKTMILISGDPQDPQHWHDKNKVTMGKLGWTVLDAPPSPENPDEMSFAESIRSELYEEAASPFSKGAVTLQYRPFQMDGGWQWAWVLLPDDRSKALAHGQGINRAVAAVAARKEARKLGVTIAKIDVLKPYEKQ